MDHSLLSTAVWGLGGAFMHAGQKYNLCRRKCQAGGDQVQCLQEFGVALLIGAIAAAAFSQTVTAYLPLKHATVNAISAGIGLIANSAVPILTGPVATWLSERVKRMLS